MKFDATKARQVPGVREVIEITGLDNPTFLMPGVAVVADSTWAAFKGRDALVVQWEEGPYANESNATLTEQFQKLLAAPPATLHNSGRVEEALASAAIVVDNTFSYPVRLARHARAPQLQRRISRWRDVGARSDPDADERAIDRRARHRIADEQGARALDAHRRRIRAAADVRLRRRSRVRGQGDQRRRDGDRQPRRRSPTRLLPPGVDAAPARRHRRARQDRRVGSHHHQLFEERLPQGSARRTFDGELRQLCRTGAEPPAARRGSAAHAHSERASPVRRAADRRCHRRLARARTRGQRLHDRNDDRRAGDAREAQPGRPAAGDSRRGRRRAEGGQR